QLRARAGDNGDRQAIFCGGEANLTTTASLSHRGSRMSFRSTNALDQDHRAGGALVVALTAVALLGACAGQSSAPFTGPPAEQVSATAPKTAGQPGDLAAAAAHQTNPTDPDAALAHARALRANHAKPEALPGL